MSPVTPKPLTPQDLSAAAKIARLDLSASRAEIVAPALEGILAAFDALDAVDVGEVAPTNAFDPRWRPQS
ncbi:hypothetical protein [Pikeienuella sp. HZG-20]|uniref:Asp-tRNA(Asn)/Glu-tRNA(Gln) amidotransferase subunit GatC n=1 Tax=Paludibacillus litoralis TaxID=3133267 RepID=UPI0030EF70D2